MSVTAVIGGQWGDEGKGKIVDYLCRDADIVARYQGGANAGHTVYINNTKLILHQIPSGILRENCHCILGNGMVIDPVGLVEEIEILKKMKINITDRIHIALNAHIVTPCHKMRDMLNESGSDNKIGTTLKGIGPAYVDKYNRKGILAFEILQQDKLKKSVFDQYNKLFNENHLTGKQLENLNQQIAVFLKCAQQIASFVNDSFTMLHEKSRNGSHILIEGAQGTMLDVDHGTYPYVTSSNPTSGGISTGLGFPGSKINENIGIFKAYTTRVGMGPFPTELNDETGQKLRDIGSEFGATTGRPRRCGWFDAVAARYSCQVNGFTKIALTKLDVLDGFDKILVCTAYKRGSIEYFNYSEAQFYLNEITPVYEQFPGWDELTAGVLTFSELPENAQKYIVLLSNLLETPVELISTGPERNQIIQL